MRYSSIEKALFKPIIREYKKTKENFWAISIEKCYDIDKKRICFNPIEEREYLEFTKLAERRIQEYLAEVDYYITRYGWEGYE